MYGVGLAERTAVIRELKEAADDFAARALEQEVRRDFSRPGTGPHHQHAHSATLWRAAERRLRARVEELQLELDSTLHVLTAAVSIEELLDSSDPGPTAA